MFNRRDVILCLCEALAMFPPTPPRPIGNLPPPSPFPFLDARHSRFVFFIFRGLVSTRVSKSKELYLISGRDGHVNLFFYLGVDVPHGPT